MTRTFGAICAVVALAACQPRIPDSAAGVGFDNAVNAPQSRSQYDGARAGGALPPAQSVSTETVPAAPQVTTSQTALPAAPSTPATPLATTATAAPQPASEAAAIANETTAALAAASANSGVLPLEASPSNPAPQVFSNPGISDENDFAAVGERRSIEADAALRAQNQANYTVIAPTAVPTRSGEQGPNVVAYALATNHPRGTKVHSRLGLTSASRYQKACAKFSSDQAAQLAFLERGGPRVDRLGVDPDGDGYACEWDPSPFRKAARN
ncbi:hypothetical protein [Shimia sp. R9_3]|uniref:hypothetical protein n=1 Tax=Shimia sp. R9_3 TaxID=2821113 RepID=UPI001ADAD708|nr:hypothetical protein [Shimia sp. R9_3]MBO9401233.1 hypothetical protein [Shimia sp. R9_3]